MKAGARATVDPPAEVTIEQLSSLSRRASAAYAVRCALRVAPLLSHLTPEEQAIAKTALRRAQSFVAGINAKAEPNIQDIPELQSPPRPTGEWVAASKAFRAAGAALAAALYREDSPTIWAAAGASKAAADALRVYALRDARREQALDMEAAERLGGAALKEASRDFDCLVELDRFRHNETMGDAFDLSDHGPLGSLWPDGIPRDLMDDALFRDLARMVPRPRAVGTIGDKIGALLFHMTWLGIVGTLLGSIAGLIVGSLINGLLWGLAFGAVAGALLQSTLLLIIYMTDRK